MNAMSKEPAVWQQSKVPLSVFDLPLPNVAEDMLPGRQRLRDMFSGLVLITVLALSMAAFGGSIWIANESYPGLVAFFDGLR